MNTFKPDRRSFLTVGALAGVGLSLADFFRAQQAQAGQKNYDFIEAKAKSVIHIYLPGGAAQQETFDPKPFAPIEYRGELKPIPTKIPGEPVLRVPAPHGRYRRQDHGHPFDDARRSGPRAWHTQYVHGLSPQPGTDVSQHGERGQPRVRPANNLPPYVCIPNQPNEFAGTGYLSSSFAPFSLGSDPASGGFQVRDLSLPGGVDDARFARRRSALDAVNDYFARKEKSDALKAMDTFYDRAYSLISSRTPARHSTSMPSRLRFATSTAATKPVSGC